MKAPAFRTTDVNTAPLDADVHVIEGVHEEFRLIWTALVTAVDAKVLNDKVDALPAAMALWPLPVRCSKPCAPSSGRRPWTRSARSSIRPWPPRPDYPDMHARRIPRIDAGYAKCISTITRAAASSTIFRE
jgi:hypothetical protein